ncbi:MAG: fasciclin domain-containing protein, partial [Candidatus Izemoplasmatales bacterium]|nr:fasciclin domain-containing protein [Candidatus Izemoplasmatales bacterium]
WLRKLLLYYLFLTFTIVIAACSGQTTTVAPTTQEPTTVAPTTEPVTTEQTTTEEQPTLNIIETAEAAGSFTTLLAALNETGLTSALEAEGQFTVFAPTDDAFNDLMIALGIDINQLLALENLDQILLFHVLSGDYYSTDVEALAPISVASLQGTNLDFTVVEGEIFVNGVQVVTEDILTTNGIIHVISAVLLYE